MIRISIWFLATVGQFGVLSVFKAFILICRVFKRLIDFIKDYFFKGNRGWIPLFFQNIGHKKFKV